MAGLKTQLKASSLIEIVVAIVIISIVSSVSILIYLNTMRSISNGKKYQMETTAQYYLDTYESLSEEEKKGFIDDAGNDIYFEVYETEWEELTELVIVLSDTMQISTVEKRKLIYQPQ